MAVTKKSADMVLELIDFPDEILIKVFVSLDSKDLLNCGQVSKRFRRISHDQVLWQRIDLSGEIVSAAFIQLILDRGCKYLDISDSHPLEFISIQDIFDNCIQLRELNLKASNFTYIKLKKINVGTPYSKDPDKHFKILIKRY